ncbi:polyprenyl diphosphate synthase [Streptomyces sp. NPDC001635]
MRPVMGRKRLVLATLWWYHPRCASPQERAVLMASLPAPDLDRARVPRHVAVILDGNRRWSRARHLDPPCGYGQGGNKVCELLDWCEHAGIAHVTLWAMSLDNLRRSVTEVALILDAVVATLDRIAGQGRWRINLVGSLDLLPSHVARHLRSTAERTVHATGGIANIAVAYDGRREIVDAVRDLLSTPQGLARAQTGLSEDVLADHLYTRGQPDVDLVIRTSGEQRLSGFMPWQTAYAELYFMPALWPDFIRDDFDHALRWFAARHRRLGQ